MSQYLVRRLLLSLLSVLLVATIVFVAVRLMPTVARYGSWKSPITSELIVAQSIALSETRLDGDKYYWLEGRPQEQGRFVVVSSDAAGSATTNLTPKPFS